MVYGNMKSTKGDLGRHSALAPPFVFGYRPPSNPNNPRPHLRHQVFHGIHDYLSRHAFFMLRLYIHSTRHSLARPHDVFGLNVGFPVGLFERRSGLIPTAFADHRRYEWHALPAAVISTSPYRLWAESWHETWMEGNINAVDCW